ncbi:MAG TPA: hypothetical protein PKB06_09120, partial [Actinotalea sp.]|nr:hypothetical protein [Actinotalea sp.]
DEPTAGTLTATASASTDALSAAAPGLAFVVEGDQLVATLATAPLAAVVVPTAGGDGIELEVTELRLGGVTVSPEDLPLGLGDAFQGLRVPVTLPAGLTLDEVAVSATGLDLTVGGRDVVLTLPPTTGPSAPG